MARNRDPFTLALNSLRDRVQTGALAGGVSIIVQDEAARLRLSTTPVREALAHLSGEGLVERAVYGGYVTCRLDAPAARDGYAMLDQYLRIAIEKTGAALDGRHPPPPALDLQQPAESVQQLFEVMVCSAGNRMLCEGFERVRRRLHPFRVMEPFLFADIPVEADALFRLYTAGPSTRFGEAVARYHARRMAASGALAALVWSPPSGMTESVTPAAGPHPLSDPGSS